jgi:CDP-diacylglycerol--glycerol-3-phosphate 3-phosphatidyltransferase
VAVRLLSTPRAQIPNALTLARLAAVPLYIALIVHSSGGRSIAAAVVFGLAGVTDQIDGFLARRWDVESGFGKIADPLADRLMIDAAVILLWHAARLPIVALVIPLRDLVAIVCTPIVVGRGYTFEVNRLGKLATWLLSASLAGVMVTHRGADWPIGIFWAGFACALLSLGGYVLKARRELS